MWVLINLLIFFQTPPGGVFAVPQQIAVLIGHLTRDADLVAVEEVEEVGLLAASTVTEGKRVESLSEPSFLTTKGVKRSDIEPSSKAMT